MRFLCCHKNDVFKEYLMVCNITCSEKLGYKSVYRNGNNFFKRLTIHRENKKKKRNKIRWTK